jgi:Fungal chitosanase of glycosyl hydrolase group 75
VFADTGPTTIIGEGSVALANALGYPSSPANGGVEGNTVTYIAFTGTGTVPAKVEDRTSIETLGNQLLQQFIANNQP